MLDISKISHKNVGYFQNTQQMYGFDNPAIMFDIFEISNIYV